MDWRAYMLVIMLWVDVVLMAVLLGHFRHWW
jgi:hypothetical protein